MRSDWTEAILARRDAAARRFSRLRPSPRHIPDPAGSRLRLTVLVSVLTGLLAIVVAGAFATPAIHDNAYGGLITVAADGAGLDPRSGGTVELLPGEAPASPPPGAPSTPAPASSTAQSAAPDEGGSGSVAGVGGAETPTGSTGAGRTVTPPSDGSIPSSSATPPAPSSAATPSPTEPPSQPATPAASPDPTVTPTPPAAPSATPTPAPTPSPSIAPACSDGIDNDGDGLVDLLDVLGCIGPFDDDESNLIL